MTYQQYLEELESIVDGIKLLKLDLENVMQELDMAHIAFTECESYDLREVGAKWDKVRDKVYDLQKGITDWRSYRVRLARWYWTSRIGNPPAL